MNFFWLALGLAALGYFIGDGLKNFSKPQRKSKYPYLIKEKDLHFGNFIVKKNIPPEDIQGWIHDIGYAPKQLADAVED